MSTLRQSPVVAEPPPRTVIAGTDVGLFVLRAAVGLVLAGHGARKLFGALGGPGLTAWEQEVGSLGYQPARWFALAHGVAEFGGGLLLILGLFFPLAAAALLGVMLNAIPTKVASGFWIQGGGFEYEVILATIGVAFAVAGPGMISLDRRFPWARGGPGSAAVGIIVGVAAGIAAYLLRSP